MEPPYVARPGGMRWFRAGAYLLLGLMVVVTVGLAITAEAIAAVSGGVGILAILVFVWAILPRRYEVWPDRLRIVFALWGWDIPFDGIETVRPGQWYEAYGFMGVRLATTPAQTVTVLRRNANLLTRPHLVISPEDREEFLRALTRAMGR